MKIKMSEKEMAAFESFARSETGYELLPFFQRIVSEHLSIRTLDSKDTDHILAREEAAKILEENIIDRMTILRGEKQESKNEFI